MKKYVKFLSVVLSVIILLPAIPLAGNAYSYEYKATEGPYTYVVNDGEAYIEDVDESISGDIVIPSILGGFPVTKIMAEAFSFCMDITDVTIPDSVTYIDMFAFSINGFETLKIPASVVEIGREENGALAAPCVGGKFKKYIVDENNPYFSSDENGVLYNKDKTVLISYPSARAAESFIIPDGVVELAEASFAFTSALKKVIMPNSIKGMNSAFYGSLIEDVVLSENCWGYLLGYCGFIYCPLLKEVSIPASFKNVNYTFVECYSLKKIIINGTNTKIDEMIFYSGYGNTKEDREEIAKYYAEFIYEKFCNGNREYGDALERKMYDTFPKNENPYSTYSIYCYKDSSAEKYAIEKGIEYFYLCDEHIPEAIPGFEATCTAEGITEGSKCSVCGEILINQTVIPAKGHKYDDVVTAPTCTEEGYTTYTCACGDSYVDNITGLANHTDGDGDEFCDYCDEYLGSAEENNCSHMCHQSGFTGFIWKIVQFFWKLFNMNPVCECGAAHY